MLTTMLPTKCKKMMTVLVLLAVLASAAALFGRGTAAAEQKDSETKKGTAGPPPLPAPLTIGSPSPKLASMKYVRGDTVTELSAGTIYVVEFSGTECVPCIKFIPQMNELQNKHTSVVFISIFNEKEAAVRGFLAAKGKEMAIRVAVDPAREMWRGWAELACLDGIPQIFIVGKDGKIAWIGHPEQLAEPLARIVAGTFDSQEDILRLKVEQGASLRSRREEKGRDENERISEMVIAGKLVDALADTEKALAFYHDCPNAIASFHLRRVYILANLPGKGEEAFKLATELAIEAMVSRRWVARRNTALTLMSAAEGAEHRVHDKRLIDLALPLLCDASRHDDDLRHESQHALNDIQIITLRFRAGLLHAGGQRPSVWRDPRGD